MADLLMLCPSRGRPGNIADLLAAWRETSSGDASLVVAVDDDDPELDAYRALEAEDLAIVVGPRLRIGGTLNVLAPAFAEDYAAVGFLGDDHRPRTPGWDGRLVEALRELGGGVVYGNDLLMGEKLPTAVAISSEIVRALGFLVPPGMVHMYFDNFWKGLGESLGRLHYLEDVVIEHMHPIAEKAPWDDGYREVNAPAMYARDRAALSRWIREDSEEAMGRVREALAERP
jgi:hypothetical protein